LNTLAHHPDLLGAMPARRSLMSDAALVATQEADVIAFYQNFDMLLQASNTVVAPSVLGSNYVPTSFAIQHWLFKAFDNYVLNDGDLIVGLQDAEEFAQAFQGCVANLSDNSGNDVPTDPFVQVNTCAMKVDPSFQ
jgi:hypothetical protein